MSSRTGLWRRVMEKFAIGIIIGGLAGALLTANNYKMRTLVKKGQAEVQAKLDKLMDEKIEKMEEGVAEIKEQASEKAEELSRKAKKSLKKATE